MREVVEEMRARGDSWSEIISEFASVLRDMGERETAALIREISGVVAEGEYSSEAAEDEDDGE